jgi:hypothetical protein
MRFHLGAVPESPNFSPDPSWKLLREPTPWVMQLMALPIGLIGFAAVGGLWFLLTPLSDCSISLEFIGGAVVFLFPIHELMHALVHPHYGGSNQSVLGFWPSKMFFYAHYDGEISRTRFITIALAPLLVISFGPLIVCAITGMSSSLLAFSSALNAFCSCVDITGAGLLLFQVPTDAVVRNQAYKTGKKIKCWLLNNATKSAPLRSPHATTNNSGISLTLFRTDSSHLGIWLLLSCRKSVSCRTPGNCTNGVGTISCSI